MQARRVTRASKQASKGLDASKEGKTKQASKGLQASKKENKGKQTSPQTKQARNQARNQARDSKHDPALSTGNRFRVGCSRLVMTHTTCAAPGSPESRSHAGTGAVFFLFFLSVLILNFLLSVLPFFSFSSSIFFYFFCIHFPSLIAIYMTFLYFCFNYLHFCLFYIISYRFFIFIFISFFFGGGSFFFC